MINATDARQLQKSGVSQDERYGAALHRAEMAIIDQSRAGKDSVRVALYHLTRESFDKFVAEMKSREFECLVESHDARMSVALVSWGER